MEVTKFNPKVSIVIPVYNGSNYLREAIDSALAQTYKDIEVIVVNDGSNDGGKTEEIAQSYGDKIRYFYKENGGVSTALNLGIREMKGEYFSWLSHDDLFSANRIEEDVHIIGKHPNVKVVFCKIAIIDGQGKLIRQCVYPIQRVTNPREALLLNGVNMCTLTIHKSCFNRTGYFNETNKTTQDVEMSLLLSKHYRFHMNNSSVTYARDHSDRGTRTLTDQHKKDIRALAEFIRTTFTISDFFPNIDDNDNIALSDAWIWMGDLYSGFGSYVYANECYKKGVSLRRNPISAAGIRYVLGGKVINSGLVKKAVYFKTKIVSFLKALAIINFCPIFILFRQ